MASHCPQTKSRLIPWHSRFLPPDPPFATSCLEFQPANADCLSVPGIYHTVSLQRGVINTRVVRKQLRECSDSWSSSWGDADQRSFHDNRIFHPFFNVLGVLNKYYRHIAQNSEDTKGVKGRASLPPIPVSQESPSPRPTPPRGHLYRETSFYCTAQIVGFL